MAGLFNLKWSASRFAGFLCLFTLISDPGETASAAPEFKGCPECPLPESTYHLRELVRCQRLRQVVERADGKTLGNRWANWRQVY